MTVLHHGKGKKSEENVISSGISNNAIIRKYFGKNAMKALLRIKETGVAEASIAIHCMKPTNQGQRTLAGALMNRFKCYQRFNMLLDVSSRKPITTRIRMVQSQWHILLYTSCDS